MPYKHGKVVLGNNGMTYVIQDQPYTGPPIPINQGSQRKARPNRKHNRLIMDHNDMKSVKLTPGMRVVFQRNGGRHEIIAHPWAPEEEFDQAWSNTLAGLNQAEKGRKT